MSEKPKVWQVTVEEQSWILERLPLRTVDKIAKDNDTTWFTVVNQPLLDLAVGEAIVAAVCDLGGITMPDLTPRSIAEMFDIVEED